MGDNTYGQLGLGPTVTNANVPQFLTNDVAAIAAGYQHSLLVTGTWLWAMGYNNHGQLGDGTTNNHYYPEHIFPGAGPVMINALSAGGFHSLFSTTNSTTASGGLWAMGDNENGQLGIGGYNYFTDSPPIVASNVVAIAAGGAHSLFIKSDGSLWGTGDNANGQLGPGDDADRYFPAEIVAPPPQISIIPYGSNVILAWPTNAA